LEHQDQWDLQDLQVHKDFVVIEAHRVLLEEMVQQDH
jgi:hypothetical protein